jgi:hypothetical protein
VLTVASTGWSEATGESGSTWASGGGSTPGWPNVRVATVAVRVGNSVGADVRVDGTVGVAEGNGVAEGYGVAVALGRTVSVRVGTSVAVAVGVPVNVAT